MGGRIEVAYESTAQEIKQAVENIEVQVEGTSGVIVGTDGRKYKAVTDKILELIPKKYVSTLYSTLGSGYVLTKSYLITYVATSRIGISDRNTLKFYGYVNLSTSQSMTVGVGSWCANNSYGVVEEDNTHLYFPIVNGNNSTLYLMRVLKNDILNANGGMIEIPTSLANASIQFATSNSMAGGIVKYAKTDDFLYAYSTRGSSSTFCKIATSTHTHTVKTFIYDYKYGTLASQKMYCINHIYIIPNTKIGIVFGKSVVDINIMLVYKVDFNTETVIAHTVMQKTIADAGNALFQLSEGLINGKLLMYANANVNRFFAVDIDTLEVFDDMITQAGTSLAITSVVAKSDGNDGLILESLPAYNHGWSNTTTKNPKLRRLTLDNMLNPSNIKYELIEIMFDKLYDTGTSGQTFNLYMNTIDKYYITSNNGTYLLYELEELNRIIGYKEVE